MTRMLMYVSEVLERAPVLYGLGVQGIAVSWSALGEGWSWRAWGPDGLWADWEALGLAHQLEEVARALYSEVNHLAQGYPRGWAVDEAILYLGPRGWRLLVGVYDMDRGVWVVREYYHGEPPKGGVEERPPYEHPQRSLRERLGYLLARYRTWFRHEAPRAWRERHGEEPTLEALLEWGRARGEWTEAETPQVAEVLAELLVRN